MNQWGLTDRGNVRRPEPGLFHHCPLLAGARPGRRLRRDGRRKTGNVASRLATDVFIREVKRTWNASLDDDALRRMLVDAVELANRAVYEHAQLSEDFSGMGTTLVAAFVKTDLAIARQRRRQPGRISSGSRA